MSRSDFKEMPDNVITGYREIDRLSYSALKAYDENRKSFKLIYVDKDEEAIQRDKDSKNSSDFIRMGNLVDTILTDNDNFHNLFVETSAVKPTAQMLTLTDLLFKITLEDTKDGIIATSFEERFTKAYEALKESNGGKLRDKLETFVARFVTEAKDYFTERLNSIGKTIITTDERILAESIVESLKTSEGTSEVVNAEGLTKFPILFMVGDIPMKMEADKLIFDHENKIIYPYDYKITSFVESFVWDSFLGKRYYIQSALYKFGLESWKIGTEFEKYRIENMGFIVADQNNYFKPLLYKTSDEHYEQGWLGFKAGARMYNGINKILENIKFSTDTNNWGMSAENIRNKGKVLIPLFKNLEE